MSTVIAPAPTTLSDLELLVTEALATHQFTANSRISINTQLILVTALTPVDRIKMYKAASLEAMHRSQDFLTQGSLQTRNSNISTDEGQGVAIVSNILNLTGPIWFSEWKPVNSICQYVNAQHRWSLCDYQLDEPAYIHTKIVFGSSFGYTTA